MVQYVEYKITLPGVETDDVEVVVGVIVEVLAVTDVVAVSKVEVDVTDEVVWVSVVDVVDVDVVVTVVVGCSKTNSEVCILLSVLCTIAPANHLTYH